MEDDDLEEDDELFRRQVQEYSKFHTICSQLEQVSDHTSSSDVSPTSCFLVFKTTDVECFLSESFQTDLSVLR